MAKKEFYAIINGNELNSIEEYNKYMQCQFYFDSEKLLIEKANKMLNNLQETLINDINLKDKSIKLEITIDKSGYLIKTHKEYYE